MLRRILIIFGIYTFLLSPEKIMHISENNNQKINNMNEKFVDKPKWYIFLTKGFVINIFNPFVWLGSFFLQPLNKMFASYYYDPNMSQYDFEYQIVSQAESFEKLEVSEVNRKLG